MNETTEWSLLETKPRLFKLTDTEDAFTFIALDHVSQVTESDDHLLVRCGNHIGRIQGEDIARFWEQWEIV